MYLFNINIKLVGFFTFQTADNLLSNPLSSEDSCSHCLALLTYPWGNTINHARTNLTYPSNTLHMPLSHTWKCRKTTVKVICSKYGSGSSTVTAIIRPVRCIAKRLHLRQCWSASVEVILLRSIRLWMLAV